MGGSSRGHIRVGQGLEAGICNAKSKNLWNATKLLLCLSLGFVSFLRPLEMNTLENLTLETGIQGWARSGSWKCNASSQKLLEDLEAASFVPSALFIVSSATGNTYRIYYTRDLF